jgi:hypothetical protein
VISLSNTVTPDHKLVMNPGSEEFLCACGRVFGQQNALTNHRRVCATTKRRLSEALSLAREKWTANKRRRLSSQAPKSSLESTLWGDHALSSSSLPGHQGETYGTLIENHEEPPVRDDAAVVREPQSDSVRI